MSVRAPQASNHNEYTCLWYHGRFNV